MSVDHGVEVFVARPAGERIDPGPPQSGAAKQRAEERSVGLSQSRHQCLIGARETRLHRRS